MKKIFILELLLSLFVMQIYAEEPKKDKEETKETQLEKETSLVDFDTIKEILKKDKLEKVVEKKKEIVVTTKEVREKKKLIKYHYPDQSDFWSFCSELWLVRNAQLLKWDFLKPDYGLDVLFKELLESLGFYETKFKILLVNTPSVTHFALPADNSENILLLSVPFMRTLDLSKTEIGILLLEDFFRLKKGYFFRYVEDKKLRDWLGKNFYETAPDVKVLEAALAKYSKFILKKGYDFQQQFEITKQMDTVLRSNLKLWDVYNKLLRKIDQLVKSNLLYENYNKIYPSPEMQLKWLEPKKPVL